MEEGGGEGERGEKGEEGEEDWVVGQEGGREEGRRAGLEAEAGSVAEGKVAWEAGEEVGWVVSLGGEAGWVVSLLWGKAGWVVEVGVGWAKEVGAEDFASEGGAERHLLPSVVDLHTYSK